AAPCRWSDDRATMARSSSGRLSHVGSRTRSVAAIRRFRQAARADRLYPLLRLLLHGNNGPHRGHHCARPACLRRCAAEHALPVSNSHVLDRALVSCNRDSPGQCDRWDRRVVLWFIWSLVRNVKGVLALNENRPIANPSSWMFG